MTDKQKSQEIANDVYIDWNDSTLATGAEYGAMKMAKWKDEQFSIERKQLIEKANQAVTQSFENGTIFKKQEIIEKACEWLESSLENDLGYYGAANFVDSFRKAMEGIL